MTENDTPNCACGQPATHAIPSDSFTTIPACGECFRKRYWKASQDTALIQHRSCANCGGAHHIQQCSEIRAMLFGPDIQSLRLDLQSSNLAFCLAHGIIDRIPAFAAPDAGWGVEPWPEAA